MIVDYTVKNNKPEIHVFWTDDHGNRIHDIVYDFEPYFYVDEDELVPSDQRIKRIEHGEFYSIFGGKVKKLYADLPSSVKELRDKFKRTYEADVLFPTRYTIDKIDKIKGNLRIATIDIEVDDSGGMPDVEKADREMYSCVIHDSWTDNYFKLYWRRDLEKISENKSGTNEITITSNTEDDFLKEIIGVINRIDPDIILGWNVSFDFKYMVNRMNVRGINYNSLSPLSYVDSEREKILGRVVFDLLDGYKKLKLKEMRSYKLDYVCEIELGKGKLKHEESINELWKDNIQKLIEYNLIDVKLVVELNKKHNIVGLYDEIRRITKVDFGRVLNYSISVDCAILDYCKGRFVLPTKGRKKVKREKIEGATVIEPTKGLFRNVIVCDITRSYPSAMITCNLSPETFSKDGDIIVTDTLKFKSEPKGVVPSVLSGLINLRKEKKRLMKQYTYESEQYTIYYTQQFALKSLINSFYGSMAYKGFRLYDDRVASAVTEVGRRLIKWCMKVAQDSGYRVIYSDTDSIFIPAKGETLEETIKEGFEIKNKIVKSFDDFALGLGCKSHVFDMDFEKVFSSILFVEVKKKYAGRLAWLKGQNTDKMKIVGFETVRSDITKVGKRIQEDLLIMINSRKKRSELSLEIYNYIDQEIKKIRSGQYKPSELAVPTALSKGFDAYKVETMALRAAKNAIFIGKDFHTGDKPLLVPLKRTPEGYPRMDVIMFTEDSDLPKGFQLDYEEVINKSIRKKCEDILDAIGMSYDEVITGKHQVTLW